MEWHRNTDAFTMQKLCSSGFYKTENQPMQKWRGERQPAESADNKSTVLM